jgi:hypothetical protein
LNLQVSFNIILYTTELFPCGFLSIQLLVCFYIRRRFVGVLGYSTPAGYRKMASFVLGRITISRFLSSGASRKEAAGKMRIEGSKQGDTSSQ